MVSSSNLNTLGGGQMKSSELNSHITGTYFSSNKGSDYYCISIREWGSSEWKRLELDHNAMHDILPYLKSNTFQDGFVPDLNLVRQTKIKRYVICLENVSKNRNALTAIDTETYNSLRQFLRIRVEDDDTEWEEC